MILENLPERAVLKFLGCFKKGDPSGWVLRGGRLAQRIIMLDRLAHQRDNIVIPVFIFADTHR